MKNIYKSSIDDLTSLSVDDLIQKCKSYLKEYISEDVANSFIEMYESNNYTEVMNILQNSLKQIKNKVNVEEYNNILIMLQKKYPSINNIIDSSLKDERNKKKNMDINGILIALIVIILAILVISCYIYFNSKKFKVKEVLNNAKINRSSYNYTEKDKDMIVLIKELSVIYRNTEKYLNS